MCGGVLQGVGFESPKPKTPHPEVRVLFCVLVGILGRNSRHKLSSLFMFAAPPENEGDPCEFEVAIMTWDVLVICTSMILNAWSPKILLH